MISIVESFDELVLVDRKFLKLWGTWVPTYNSDSDLVLIWSDDTPKDVSIFAVSVRDQEEYKEYCVIITNADDASPNCVERFCRSTLEAAVAEIYDSIISSVNSRRENHWRKRQMSIAANEIGDNGRT